MPLNITIYFIRYKSKELKYKLSHTCHLEVKWKLKTESRLDEWFSNSLDFILHVSERFLTEMYFSHVHHSLI